MLFFFTLPGAPDGGGESSGDEDALFVKRAGKGDVGAFEFLVQKYEKKVYGMTLRMLADREDASDAAQEAFLKAYRSLSGFRGASKFSTWLYRITNNVCLDFLRRRNANVFSLDARQERDDGAMMPELPSDFDVEALAEGDELRALVRLAIGKLPENHRAMIVMRDMQGLEYSEIAELLGVPEGTVKSRLNRARGQLRAVILGLRELKEYADV